MRMNNDVIRGYLLSACENANFSEEDTKKLLNGLWLAFDEITPDTAEKIYIEYASK